MKYYRRLKRGLSVAGQQPEDTLLSLYIWSRSELIANLFSEPLSISFGRDLTELYKQHATLGVVEGMMRVDHKYDLRSLNLTYTDRMSMAAGVEVRVPFLDFELVRLMNSIPSNMKIRGMTTKYILKKAMEGRLLKSNIYREKAGFGLPIRSWLRKPNEITDLYLSPKRLSNQGLFNPEFVQRLCSEQFAGQEDHASILFSLICIQMWFESNSIDVN